MVKGYRCRRAAHAYEEAAVCRGLLAALALLVLGWAAVQADSPPFSAIEGRSSDSAAEEKPVLDRAETDASKNEGKASSLQCPFPVCVERDSSQLKLWRLRGATPSNVVVGCDIEDSLLCSGGWRIGKSFLGGPDCRYPRGAAYPGISVLMYLLSLGPHEAIQPSSAGEAPSTAKPQDEPLPLVLISPQPSSTLFRPAILYEQIAAITSHAAKQATGDVTATWRVGNESCVEISAIRDAFLLRKEKLHYVLRWRDSVAESEGEDGAKAPGDSRLIFFGSSHNQDIEVAAGMGAVGGRFLAAFIHLVHDDGDELLPFTSKNPELPTLRGVQRFGIEFGRRAVEAVQLLFDVYVEQEGMPTSSASNECGALSENAALHVGSLLGQKLRSLLHFYSRRWLRNSSTFKVNNYAEPLMPIFFIKCRRVIVRKAAQSSAHRTGVEPVKPLEPVDLKFINDALVDVEDLGFPIVVYRTAVSAASHALVLSLLHPHEAVKVARTELRSQGPITHPSRLPALVDHFYSVRGLLRLLQPASPQDFMDPVQRRAQSLFAEVAELVRRAHDAAVVPTREELCSVQWRERLEGVTVFRKRLRDFARPFISFICNFDLQLTKLRDAGTEELECIAFALGRAIIEGLDVAAAAVVAHQRGELWKLTYGASLLEEGEKIPVPEQCPWEGNPLVLNVFTRLSDALCAELPTVAKGVLQQRLAEEGLFAELLQVAEWRKLGAKIPLHLHTFDLVMPPSNQRQSRMRVDESPQIELDKCSVLFPIHARFRSIMQGVHTDRFARAHDILEALLGDAARGGLISKPASTFSTYNIEGSEEAWKEVAEALTLAVQCDLLAGCIDAPQRLLSKGRQANAL
ncbi:hypothetical protein Emag_005982 [Eimeria magna]